jgi:uncharacterized membrane protein
MARSPARLGADGDGRHVVRDGVVQVAGQPFAFEQHDPVEVTSPCGGLEPYRQAQRERRQQHGGAADDVGHTDPAQHHGQGGVADDDRRADQHLATGPPPDQRVGQQQQVHRRVRRAGRRPGGGDGHGGHRAERDDDHQQRAGPAPPQGRHQPGDQRHGEPAPRQVGTQGALQHRQRDETEQHPVAPHPAGRARRARFTPQRTQHGGHPVILGASRRRQTGRKDDAGLAGMPMERATGAATIDAMTTQRTPTRSGPGSRRPWWLGPVALVALSGVPAVAGSVRLTELASTPAVTADNARFVGAPVPVVLHIVGATLFCLLGAWQFAAVLRQRRPGLHRAMGRVVVPAGIVAALSGMWMTLFYDLPASDGAALGAVRLVLGATMAGALVRAVTRIRSGDVTAHRAWMMRAYAIGAGAGTQAVILLTWSVAGGGTGEPAKTVLMTAAWAINLGVAEWLVRGGRRRRQLPTGRGAVR